MRSKLCYGLLLALPIMFGLSLSVCSDTNALKYDITTIPLAFPNSAIASPNFYSSIPSFKAVISSDISSENLHLNKQKVFTFVKQNDGKCYGYAFKELPDISRDSDDNYVLKYGFTGYNFAPSFSYDSCMLAGGLLGDSTFIGQLSTNQWQDFLSLNSSGSNSANPNRFSYDGFYLNDTYDYDGLHYDTKIDLMSALFEHNNYPSAIQSLSIPLGPSDPSVASSLTPGTPISFTGELLLDPEDLSSFGLDSDTSVSLNTVYIQNANGYVSSSSPCIYTFVHDDPNDSTSIYSFKYQCDVTLSTSTNYSFPWFVLDINFAYTSANSRLQMLIFDSSVSITNNNNLPGGNFNTSITGSDLHSAPGSAYQSTMPYEDTNFISSLVNLFSGINLVNPFYPIFSLFSDNDSCASIPTIAGMLHSNETTICPWFDSQTRNIMTPVIGLASSMLLFGFVVRWLGSRSGNFVEDSVNADNIDSYDGRNFSNNSMIGRFRRHK